MTSHPQSSEPQAGLSVFFPAYNDGGTIASMVVAAMSDPLHRIVIGRVYAERPVASEPSAPLPSRAKDPE